jgi:hypothetical protein
MSCIVAFLYKVVSILGPVLLLHLLRMTGQGPTGHFDSRRSSDTLCWLSLTDQRTQRGFVLVALAISQKVKISFSDVSIQKRNICTI